MKHLNINLFAVLNHYDFLIQDTPLFHSFNFFNYNSFTFVPDIYQSTEKEIIYFYDFF